MTDILAKLITWLNVPANAFGRYALQFIAEVPGWLSNTIISAVTGVVFLLLFKYTSNQRAISKVKDTIKANILAIWLFKDSISVVLKSELGAFRAISVLLFLSTRPVLFAIIPVCLLIFQLGAWYQFRPLQPKEQAVVTAKLSDDAGPVLNDVDIEPSADIDVVVGPIRMPSENEVVWEISPAQAGIHHIRFRVGEDVFEKTLAAGDGFMPISPKRPGWKWLDIFMYPLEKPFTPESPVRSIAIDYPERVSLTSGADWWLVYFLVVSMVFAFIFKPVFKVNF